MLVTGSGSPGTAALVRALRENGERDVRIVGVDMSERSVGRHLCDAFHVVVPSGDPFFVPSLLEIVEQEERRRRASADVVRPAAAGGGARQFPVPVLVSSPETVRRSNDKAETYSLLRYLGVTAPDFRRARGGGEVQAAARELGYPERDVAVKPVFSSGSRGFRILSASADRHEQLLTNRPGVAEALRLEELVELLGDDETELLVMELARRRRADDRRDRRRQARRARPPEDARGDARRPRDVLRHARRRRH